MRSPSMRRQKTIEIAGIKCTVVLTRRTSLANFVGWNFKVTSEDGVSINGFTGLLELDRAFDSVIERADPKIGEARRDARFDKIFDEWQSLADCDRMAVSCYMLGMFSKVMSDFHLDSFEEQVIGIKKVRAELDESMMKKATDEFENSSYFDALRKNFPEEAFAHKIELTGADERGSAIVAICRVCKDEFWYKRDAVAHIEKEHMPEPLVFKDIKVEESDITKDIPTEDLPNAAEEVEVTDCCRSKDFEAVTPPLRHSQQSSPDDPYYVCNACHEICDLETWTEKELEEKE